MNSEPERREAGETGEADAGDLSQEVHVSRFKIVNVALVILGTLCVGLGIIGIVLPVVPTTPFLLLAAICYARSSPRFYIWLFTNRYFGQYIRDFRENKGLARPVKIRIIVVLAATMGLSMYFVPRFDVRILLAIIGTCITIYIWRLPTKAETTR